MKTIQELFNVAPSVRMVEAVSDHKDPFLSRPIAVNVTEEDIKEAAEACSTPVSGEEWGQVCAISVAMKNSCNAIACLTMSRMVYLLRKHPKTGILWITKHQLTAASARLVKRFDKTKKVPHQLIEIIPMAPSHTKAAREAAKGTGVPRGPREKKIRAPRPLFLRPRIAPRQTKIAA